MATQGGNLALKSVAEFSLNNYLTGHQRTTFYTLDSRLKEIIMSRLLVSQEPQDLTKVRLTLDIVASCPDAELQRVVDLFFLTVLNTKNSDGDINISLAKLKKICRLNAGAKTFFTCASTKKVNYYTIETLQVIIDRFSGCLKAEESSIPSYLRNLPCYDEGGETLFTKIHQNPVFNSTALVESVSGASFLHNQQNSSLKELLAKSLSFKNMRVVIEAYLISLPESNRLKQDIYNHFFDFLQNDPSINLLKDLEKSELLKMSLITTTDQHHPVLQHYTVADLKEMAEEARSVHEDCGEEVLIFFYQGLSRQKQASLDETIQALKFVHAFSQDIEKFSNVNMLLENFQKGDINLTKLIEHLEQLASETLPPVDATQDMKALMKRFGGNDPNVKFPLDAGKLQSLEGSYLQIQTYCDEWQHCRMSALVNKAHEIRQKLILDNDDLVMLMAIGRLALRIKFFPIYLHSTQVLTVLGLLAHQKGCIAQVKTGEGKSMIVACMAFVLSMLKQDVHIISSSQPLAKRDQNKFSSFFKIFGITSSHICRDQRRREHFDAQLLYGTASDYEFAIMEEMLHFSKLFPRKFENTRAIVDEVDNLTIDTALSGARFGYPAEITFNYVYLPIFKFLQENIAKNEKQKIVLPETLVHLKTYLQGYKEGHFKTFIDTLSNDKLRKWLLAAFHALYELAVDKDYIIEQLSTPNGDTKLGVVIIDDKNTGKRMDGCRWTGGIHEFVEVKHHIEVDNESITPISMSHPVFYPFYSNVYGLTGTIGSQSERDEIKEIYGMDSFDVPTYKPSLRHDAPPRILLENDYIEAILTKITTCRQKGRPILVLCKTIHDTLILEKKLKDLQIPHEMLNEKQQKKEEDILENAGLPGAVTVATNNAGRGTDIQLKGSSTASGGLHVLITFYPDSLRVEEQARGRAGRQGEPGSSEILISAQTLALNQIPDLANPHVHQNLVKKLTNERRVRGNMMKHLHACRATLDRFCFNLVKQFYQKLERFNMLLDDHRFLSECSRNLSHRLLNIEKPDFSILPAKDRPIAEEAFKLFQETDVAPMQWLILLEKSCKRVKEKTINEWAVNFLAQVEEMIQNSKIEKLGGLKEGINQTSQELSNQAGNNDVGLLLLLHSFALGQEEKIINATDQEVNNLKVAIRQLYDKLLADWGEALDVQGVGIIDYLGKLLSIKLPSVRDKPTKLMVI